MKSIPIVVAVIMIAFFQSTHASAQSTAFTYQGSLTDNGGLADGIYDFEFDLFAASSGGASLGTSASSTVDVVGGIFSVQLDFGAGAFDGSDRYLEISTRFNGDPSFTTLAPRVSIDSVPYATYAAKADVANYASDGPFEPRDPTPASFSGAGGQSIGTELVLTGDSFTDVEAVYLIILSREAVITQSGVLAGAYHDFTVEFSTQYDSRNNWEQHFDQSTSQVQAQIITTSGGSNMNEFLFYNGIVSGYRLEQDRFLLEVISITFSFAQISPGPMTDFITRDASGYSPIGHGPFAPYLGGDAVLPDTYFFAFDGNVPLYSGVGVFPGEDRFITNGLPTNGIEARPVTMLHNVFGDRFNVLWDEFAGFSGGIGNLDLRDSSGTIWTPPTAAVISSWTLDKADDGGLFETYEFVYNPSPQFP